VILGGPEVSYEAEDQEIVRLADYVIGGEADLAFAAACEQLLTGSRPVAKSPLRTFRNSAVCGCLTTCIPQKT